jgi:hypothetical protein
MQSTELKELSEYWTKKYPHVTTTLWENKSMSKYFGKMRTQDSCQDLSADTIGELISQGEIFLRRVTR